MQCEKFRNMILESKKDALSAQDTADLLSHMECCEECRTLESAKDAMESLSRRWKDQDPPAWDRVPSILKSQSQWPFRLSWLPLAAALFLACFVLLRLEVRFDDEGFLVTFGGSSASRVDETQMEEFRNQVFTELQKMDAEQNDKLDEALFQVQSNQNQVAKDILVTVMERNRLERRDEMTQLFANWRKQRRSDMEMLGTQVQTLYQGQVKNRQDLVAIAEYVDDKPFIP